MNYNLRLVSNNKAFTIVNISDVPVVGLSLHTHGNKLCKIVFYGYYLDFLCFFAERDCI